MSKIGCTRAVRGLNLFIKNSTEILRGPLACLAATLNPTWPSQFRKENVDIFLPFRGLERVVGDGPLIYPEIFRIFTFATPRVGRRGSKNPCRRNSRIWERDGDRTETGLGTVGIPALCLGAASKKKWYFWVVPTTKWGEGGMVHPNKKKLCIYTFWRFLHRMEPKKNIST